MGGGQAAGGTARNVFSACGVLGLMERSVTREDRPVWKDPSASLEERVAAAVEEMLAAAESDEVRTQAAVWKALSFVIADERKRFARLVGVIRDEYVDWCALNRIPSGQRMEVAKMLGRLAKLVGGASSAKE